MSQIRSSSYRRARAESKRYGEKADCAVVALSIALKAPYSLIRDQLTYRGREPGKGTPQSMLESVIITEHQRVMINRTREFRAKGVKTVNNLRGALPKRGIFIVYTARHVLCARNGEVHDWTDGRRHRVQEVYEIVTRKAYGRQVEAAYQRACRKFAVGTQVVWNHCVGTVERVERHPLGWDADHGGIAMVTIAVPGVFNDGCQRWTFELRVDGRTTRDELVA